MSCRPFGEESVTLSKLLDMREETTTFDRKSLKTVQGKNPEWEELAKDCVAFANARGGHIFIGIEDDSELPPAGQSVPESLPGKVQLRLSQITINTSVLTTVVTASNGGQYIDLTVQPSVSTIASTTDGKYFIRIGDSSTPLHPDQLLRLLNDKPAYSWETKVTRVSRYDYDPDKFSQFISDVKNSQRVSSFVKEKSDDEIVDYYLLTEGEYLTNLGVLWIGQRNDRAMLKYAPAIQFLKFDERGEKVNKMVWDDYSLNPKELIERVWSDIPDWKEGIEVSDGIFRDFIPNYGERTVRELVTNAIVHRPYTTAGDIFINLYPDRMEIHNPGGFPVGVTPKNILHESRRRNEHLCKVAYDLLLMEKEGSGYDVVYEDLLANGKPAPAPEEREDRVVVTVSKLMVKPEIVRLIKTVSEQYNLTRKEKIAFGLIAQNQSLSALQFSKMLDLKGANPTRGWLDRLVNNGIILSQGKTRGTEYFVNPEIIRSANFSKAPSLKTIEPHRLRELIYEDLKAYPGSSMSEISNRIGSEISRYKIREQLKTLIEQGRVISTGVRAATKYACKK